VFSSVAAFAPAFHGGFALLPLFIIGHVFWFIIIVLLIVFALTGRRRRMARWAAMGQAGGWGPWGHGHGFGGFGGSASRAAETTLAERFAQGDIDEKEYRARLEVLRANNTPQPPTA
jgi:putative membrane protein